MAQKPLPRCFCEICEKLRNAERTSFITCNFTISDKAVGTDFLDAVHYLRAGLELKRIASTPPVRRYPNLVIEPGWQVPEPPKPFFTIHESSLVPPGVAIFCGEAKMLFAPRHGGKTAVQTMLAEDIRRMKATADLQGRNERQREMLIDGQAREREMTKTVRQLRWEVSQQADALVRQSNVEGSLRGSIKKISEEKAAQSNVIHQMAKDIRSLEVKLDAERANSAKLSDLIHERDRTIAERQTLIDGLRHHISLLEAEPGK